MAKMKAPASPTKKHDAMTSFSIPSENRNTKKPVIALPIKHAGSSMGSKNLAGLSFRNTKPTHKMVTAIKVAEISSVA
jgi:hypothetical protein